MFNVSDVENPQVADEIIIGDRSTNSEALYNHKAFFFDKSRGILSIPISGNGDSLKQEFNSKIIAPEFDQWSGFYVYDLSSSNGFEPKGSITHVDMDSRYYGMSNARTFYIEDVLYTVSEEYLKMNSMEDLENINSIKLENTGKFIEYLEEEIEITR